MFLFIFFSFFAVSFFLLCSIPSLPITARYPSSQASDMSNKFVAMGDFLATPLSLSFFSLTYALFNAI